MLFRKKLIIFTYLIFLSIILLVGRLAYLIIKNSDMYQTMALDQQYREREIKAARGDIVDRNGNILATSIPVCTVFVIPVLVEDADEVTDMLVSELGLDRDEVYKKVTKNTAVEKIKGNIDRDKGIKINTYNIKGVKVDEDYKRFYPYNEMLSKVLGFAGGDNQGVVGIEVKYDEYLKGINGNIQTKADVSGHELENEKQIYESPIKGKNLVLTVDYYIHKYITQMAYKVLEEKQAKNVSIIVMNPNNGEIYGMANVPEYNLNEPFAVAEEGVDPNAIWRNTIINDTYEPGSTFKIITATAALSEGVVSLESRFSCPGYKIVEDRRIRCHKVNGHGGESFLEAVMNSCNPVFITVGLATGKENMYKYMEKLGFFEKTGIDLPGEANSIMHNLEDIGEVELATISFGQSFQITPLQLLRAVSSIINGGTLITPHFGLGIEDENGENITLEYKTESGVISNDVSEKVKYALEKVVSEGGGLRGQVEGYSIGGKTATSEKLPRGNGKYISSFIGYAPADNPQVIAMCIIDEPVGIYYGGTIAAPVISNVFDNILPYLGIERKENVEK